MQAPEPRLDDANLGLEQNDDAKDETLSPAATGWGGYGGYGRGKHLLCNWY